MRKFQLQPEQLQPAVAPPRELTPAETAQVAAGGTGEPPSPPPAEPNKFIRIDRPFRK